jgi:hypothetical protein
LLQRDNHVVTPAWRFSISAPPQLEFGLVGRNSASTFTGLCGPHDDQLFAPIEKNPLDLSDLEHLFLLAYRAATRELHATMEAAVKLQTAYQERIDRGLDSPDDPTPAGLEATTHILLAYQTFRYRSILDEALLGGDFSSMEHDVVVASVSQPTVAVSSLFSAGSAVTDRDVALVHLSVIPVSITDTAVVWSYTRASAQTARKNLHRVFESTGRRQLHEISRVILAKCENLVLSPSYFASWSPNKIRAVADYFVATMGGEAELDSPDLDLFDAN